MSHCQALTNSVSSLCAIQWRQKGLGFNGIYVMVAYLWSSDHVLMSSRRSCSMCTCTHQKVLKDDPNFHPLAATYVNTQVPKKFLTALYSPSSFSVQNDSICWAPYHGALWCILERQFQSVHSPRPGSKLVHSLLYNGYDVVHVQAVGLAE